MQFEGIRAVLRITEDRNNPS